MRNLIARSKIYVKLLAISILDDHQPIWNASFQDGFTCIVAKDLTYYNGGKGVFA